MHNILQPHAELAPDINTRLITESHVRRERHLVAANKVRPFMSVDAKAVPYPVRKVLVTGTKSGLLNYFARSAIHCLARHTWTRGCKGNTLGAVHDFKYMVH